MCEINGIYQTLVQGIAWPRDTLNSFINNTFSAKYNFKKDVAPLPNFGFEEKA